MLDPSHMDAELAHAYGLDRGERSMPDALLASIRAFGWVAFGLWIGALVAVEAIVPPVAAHTLHYIPELVRHQDWQERAAGYIFFGCMDHLVLLGGICAFALLITTLAEARNSSCAWWLAYAPAALDIILIGTLVECLNLRNDIYWISPVHYGRAVAIYQHLIYGQIGCLILLCLLLTWNQTKTTRK